MVQPSLNQKQAEGKSSTARVTHHRAARNTIANWLGYAANVVVGFLLAPYMVHHLGDVAYGVWGLALQIGAYLGLSDFGIRIAVSRYLTHYHTRNQHEEVDRVLSASLLILTGIGILGVLISFVVARFLPAFIKLPPGIVSQACWTVFLMGLVVAISFPGAVFPGALAAVFRYDLTNSLYISAAVARALLIWACLAKGFGVVSVAAAFLVTGGAGSVAAFFLARRVYGGFQFRWPLARLRPYFPVLMKFSTYAFLLSISGRLVYWSDNLVVGAILGPAAVTFYAIGGALVEYLRSALDSTLTIFVPMATAYDAANDREALRRLLLRGARLGSLLILPGILGFLVIGAPFITLWMGSRYTRESAGVLTLLTLSLLFAAMRGTCHQILYGINRHKFNAFWSLGEALANLGLSVALALKIGLLGVAWGTLVPALFVGGLIIPAYAARQLGVARTTLYWQGWLVPVLVSLPYGAFLAVSRYLGVARTWSGFWGTLVIGLALYGVSVWFAGLSRQEKEFLTERGRSFFSPAVRSEA